MYNLKISLLLSRSIFRRAIGSRNLFFIDKPLGIGGFGGVFAWRGICCGGVWGTMGGKLAGIKDFCAWACVRLGWGRVLRENRASE